MSPFFFFFFLILGKVLGIFSWYLGLCDKKNQGREGGFVKIIRIGSIKDLLNFEMGNRS